ncbi:PA14 domain-containing protein [Archangium gephyra]|uniref:PA14 domain-containing protein n=1 Tax=Archangium gephyra TaxID=48 RepID=UPI0035D42D99
MNTPLRKSGLLFCLILLSACGSTDLSDAPPSPELAQAGEPLTGTASTCGPSQISWDANLAGTPSWENGRCAGPWQYSEYTLPCYINKRSPACGIEKTNYTTCSRNLSCRHPDFGLDYRTAQGFSTRIKPSYKQVRTHCDEDGVCYYETYKDYDTPCRNKAITARSAIDDRYEAGVTFNYSVTDIDESSSYATCKYTLYNYPIYIYAAGPQCGTESYTCINQANPYEYYACRHPDHGDDTPGACGYVTGRKYSPPGMTLTELKQVSAAVVTQQTSAYDPSGIHKAFCTTGDELPLKTATDSQDKYARLMGQLTALNSAVPPGVDDNQLRRELVTHLWLLFETRGTHLSQTQRDELIKLYTQYPEFNGVTRLDPQVNFDWAGGAPLPSMGADFFSVRWTGRVTPRYSETYTFHTITDDGVRLQVNGQLLIDKWVDQSPTEHTGTIALVAGTPYDLTLEYYERGGGATVQLLWSSPSQPREVIPSTQLSTRDTLQPGLFAQYFDNMDFTSVADCDNRWTPPVEDGACTGSRELNTTLAMCHRMTLDHVSPHVAELMLDKCIDAASSISKLSCHQDRYRQSWSALMTTLLSKQLSAIHAQSGSARTTALQKKLALIDRWYRAARTHVYLDDGKAPQLGRELSEALGEFWRGAYNSSPAIIGIKPSDTKEPPATTLVTASNLPFISNTYLEVDRAVVEAAFTAMSKTTPTGTVTAFPVDSVPLLLVLEDAFRGLAQRLDSVSASHDLGCRFRGCRANNISTEVSLTWLLLGSLNDISALNTANLASAKVRDEYETLFKKIASGHSALTSAVVDAVGGTYTKDTLASTLLDKLPPAAVGLARLLRHAQIRTDNYHRTGFFDADARNVLHTGMNIEKEAEIDSMVDARLSALQIAINTYATNRDTLINNTVQEMRAERTQESINNQLLLKLEQLSQLGKDLAGLRHNAAVDRARHADLVRSFNKAASSPQLLDFQVSVRSPETLSVSAAHARYIGMMPSPADALANLTTEWSRSANQGDILHIEVAGNWAPTCAMRSPVLGAPWGEGGSMLPVDATGVTTGPEGFLVQFVDSAYKARSNTSVSENGTYGSMSVTGSFCAGVGVEAGVPAATGFSGRVYAQAETCVKSDVGARVSTTRSESSSSGGEERSTAAFSSGLRLPNTPFPLLPAGSLLLLEVEPGGTQRGHIQEIHVLQRPYNTVQLKANRVLYLVVNDRAGCTSLNTSPLTLTVRHTEPLLGTGGKPNKAGSLLTALTHARAVIETEGAHYLQAGRVTAQELAALRGKALLKLQESVSFTPDELPSHLSGLFSNWVDHDLAALARKAELLATERQMLLLQMELKAMRDDLDRQSGESRLLRLLPLWSLRNLEGTHLEVKTADLAQVVVDYLYPILHLRYPQVFTALQADVTARNALLALTDGNAGTTAWDDSHLAVAEHMKVLVERLKVLLAKERLASAGVPPGASYDIVAISFPRPGFPHVEGFPEWRVADETRSRLVWEGLDDPSRSTFSVTVTPEDLYDADGGLAMLCNQGAMVIRSMAVFFSRPGEFASNDTLNSQLFRLPVTVDPMLSFATRDGLETYEQLNQTWLGSYVYPVFGTPTEAIDKFKLYAQTYRKGNGLSPFARFDFGATALRNWSANPLAQADQLILVFEVQLEPLSTDMTWISTCNPSTAFSSSEHAPQ